MDHVHITEIPRRYIRSGTKARSYQQDIIRAIRSLQYTHRELEYASQIATFNILSLVRQNVFQPYPQDVFDSVEEFAYHYENYCYRLFTLREKVLQFTNAALKIGYSERDATIKNLSINPLIKDLKLNRTLARFDANSNDPLGKIVKDRHKLTHKLYYGQGIDHLLRPLAPSGVVDESSFEEWCKSWKQEITSRTQLVGKAEMQVSRVNHELSEALMKYFEKKMNIIDLSVTLNEDTPVYPGDPKTVIKPAGVFDKDGFNDHTVTVGTHVGTHIDAPFHMIEDGKTLDQVPVGQFVGRGCYIKVDGKFDLEDIKKQDIREGDIVLFNVGADAYYREPRYYSDTPEIPEEVAQYLVSKKIKAVGMDMSGPDAEPFKTHKILLGGGVLIIENLTNLDKLAGKDFTVYALPIKLELDGAPARVIAQIQE